MLSELAEQLYSDVPDQELFHYTSLDGLIGIATSTVLWASEIRYLNDELELSYFGDLMTYFARQAMSNDECETEIMRQILDWLKFRFGNGPLVFTASFTANGNLLSQWRGYCPHGQGVSLGFPPTLVAGTIAETGFHMGRCVYDPTQQQEIARNTVLELLHAASAAGPDAAKHVSQSHWTTFEKYEDAIVRIGALIKHPSFREEAEWRCVSEPVSNYVTTNIAYRVGRTALIPYIGLPLPDVGGGLGVTTVYVGPSPTPNIAINSVSMFLRKYAGQGFQRTVLSCGIPYRT